jgi:hypothetical protein
LPFFHDFKVFFKNNFLKAAIFEKRLEIFSVFKKGFIHQFIYKHAATLMVEEFLLSSWIT